MKAKRKKRRLIPTLLTLLLLMAAGFIYIGFYGLPMTPATIQQYTSISAISDVLEVSVHGTGTIAPMNTSTVYAKSSGTIKNLLISQDEAIAKGQLILTLENETQTENIKNLETNLRNLDIELSSMSNIKGATTIAAPADGRMKDMKVEKGSDVMSAVSKYGYLCLLSLDGRMKLTFSPSMPVKAGDVVSVLIHEVIDSEEPGTTEIEGFISIVDSATGEATAIIQEDRFAIGALAEVTDESGGKIGDGQLELNRALPILAQSGSIKTTNGKENKSFNKGNTLFTLDGDIVTSALDQKLLEREQAKADLEKAVSELEKLNIYANDSGIVTDLTLEEGATVQKDQAICGLQSADAFKLVIAVDELDISMVAVGQFATVTVDALPKKIFSGKVTKISGRGTASNGVTSYDVTLEVENPEGIRDAMSASADILVARNENALLVPVDAIQTVQNESYVLMSSVVEEMNARAERLDRERRFPLDKIFKTAEQSAAVELESEDAQMTKVETGLANDDFIEILSGLNEGDEIAIVSASASNSLFGSFMPGGGGSRSGTGIAFPR